MKLENKTLTITIETKLEKATAYPQLEVIGRLYNNLKRRLYKRIIKESTSIAKLKKEFLSQYQIPARFFNSIYADLKGQIKSHHEMRRLNQSTISRKIRYLEEQVRQSKEKYVVFQKRRKIYRLQQQLNKPRREICFGGRNFFNKQFTGPEYITNHELWRQEWELRRNGEFTFLGSKDESYGNQLCQLIDNKLRIRLPNCLAVESKYIEVPIEFHYYQDYLKEATGNHKALTWRFKKRANGYWYVFLTFTLDKEVLDDQSNGVFGIDLNYESLAVSETDRYGNWIGSGQYHFSQEDKSSEQSLQEVSLLLDKIVVEAGQKKKNLVIENLDIKDKSGFNRLANRKKNYLLYRKSFSLLESKCTKRKVKLIKVNPAYTTIIGENKYRYRYGINQHEAASFVIARRGMGFKDMVPVQLTCFLPGRIKNRHHWSHWNWIRKNLPTCLKRFNSLSGKGFSREQLLTGRFNRRDLSFVLALSIVSI
ncbi:MAG: hypothetical protein GH154_04515 [Firmicutes bacterium]|nr:hypothetical protein [Bacillota bacterium]